MATNIVIKKLEDNVFDDHIEAEKRLNELGINSGVTSEIYQNLADQVRETCPCNCYFSTRKSYMVDVEYEGKYYDRRDILHPDNPNSGSGNYSEFAISGTGYGTISKGSKSCQLVLTSSSSIDKMAGGYYPNEFNESDIRNASCSKTFESNSTFSIRLSDDCKHWIFSFTPSWIGGYSPEGMEDSCFEQAHNGEFNGIINDNNIDSIEYPEVTTAFPNGTMTSIYKFVQDENVYDEGETSYYTHVKVNNYVKITAKVTLLDDSTNNLNTINSLYSDLDNSLK